jgi:hypothetical protein
MKRQITIALLMIIIMTAAAGIAQAGIIDTVTTFITDQAVTVLITGLIAILGTFGVAYKLWGVAGKELYEFVKSIMSAVDPDGPDGRKINDAEMERIIKEGREFFPAVAKAYQASRKKG